jgi:protein TonB
MRPGIIIGFATTVTIEFLVAWGGNLTHYVPKPKVKEQEPKITIVMPKYDPDPPELVEGPTPTGPVDLAPPMQEDVPQVATPESFIQQIEPPPPELSSFSRNIVKIPETRSFFGTVAVIDISNLDQVPVAKYRARPIYPTEMARAGVSGEVLVDFIVDTEGSVRNARAVQSSHREFEDNAVSAVSKWKFIPGKKNKHVVFTHMQVPIRFILHKGED